MNGLVDRQLRTILDSVPDGVLVEAGDRIAYLNLAYARMLHYPSTLDLQSATIGEIVHPEDLERLRWYGVCRSRGNPAPARYSFRARGRDGTAVTLDASVSAMLLDGQILITTIVRELAPRVNAPRAIALPGMQRLSAREGEVIEHLLEGKRSKEIALMLDVSEKTICTHRSRAFRKLALRGDRDLFRLATEVGLIPR